MKTRVEPLTRARIAAPVPRDHRSPQRTLQRLLGVRHQSLIQNFLVTCVMVPRGKLEVCCLSRVAMGPASSFPLGTQTSRTLPGSFVLVNQTCHGEHADKRAGRCMRMRQRGASCVRDGAPITNGIGTPNPNPKHLVSWRF